MISYQAKSIREQFHQIRQLYEIQEIQNKVPDGKISFPEDSRSLASGIAVEFRYIHFSSNPIVLQALKLKHFGVETSPSSIPARTILHSATCHSKLRKVNFA